jgi:hypothetical protein
MAVISPRKSLISAAVIVAGVFGLILAVSVFLPWLTPKGEASSVYDNASGMSVSSLFGLTGIAGGLLAVAAAFIPAGGIKKALHILIGLAAVGVLALMIINGTLPLLSSVVRKYVGMGFGLYLYAFAGLALVLLGLMEKSRSSQAPQQWAPSRPVHQYAQPAWTPPPAAPPPVMSQYSQPAAYPQPTRAPQAYGRHCGNCGQPVKPGVSFCASCGQPLSGAGQPPAAYAPPASPSCPACGRACSANAAFCPVCGVPIKR